MMGGPVWQKQEQLKRDLQGVAGFVAEQGGKECRMSRILLLGEGRVGKTALYNSLMGRPFKETSSTVGVKEGFFEVQGADMQGWKEYVRGEQKVTRLPRSLFLSLSRCLYLPCSLALSLSPAHQRLP